MDVTTATATITITTLTSAAIIPAAVIITISQRITDRHTLTAGSDQHTLITGTGQHPTLAGTDQHTTTIDHLITADGAAHTAVTTTTTAAMVDLAGAGKLVKKVLS